MSTLSQEPAQVANERPRWSSLRLVPELWASLAIVVMWLAVLFTAVWGPNIVNTSGGPAGSSSTVPSAVVVALFAFLGTWVVARYGFRRQPRE
jgi:hypothetical protein